jgi:hypothetical protein
VIERVGMPQSVADPEQCSRLGFAYRRVIKGWSLLQEGEVQSLPTVGRGPASDGEALRQLAIAGAVPARVRALPDFLAERVRIG